MPFGIQSAPEHYQKKITQILEGLDGHISIIDDMLIHGKTQKEHDERVRAVLKKLDEAGTTLNPENCECSKRKVKFAGHVISEDGIKTDPEKVESVQGTATPQNVSDLQRFFGMVNQLGRFIPHLTEKTKPLRDLLTLELGSVGVVTLTCCARPPFPIPLNADLELGQVYQKNISKQH